MRKSAAELQAIRRSVELAGRLSDRLFHLGPFGIGIEGILSWIPGVGEAYGALAGAFIVVQGARAGVPAPVLAAATALLVLRILASSVPVLGAAFSDVFTAHRWAARLILDAMDRQMHAAPDAYASAPPRRSYRSPISA